MFKNSILLVAVVAACLMAGASNAFELDHCVKDMEAAFEGFNLPESIEHLVEIIRLANDNKKLLLLDDIGAFAKRQLESRPHPAECDSFNLEVRQRVASVKCSEFIQMEKYQHRAAVANSRLDEFLGAIGACSVTKKEE